ncbi:unnamed protein product [Ixodes pacificus]
MTTQQRTPRFICRRLLSGVLWKRRPPLVAHEKAGLGRRRRRLFEALRPQQTTSLPTEAPKFGARSRTLNQVRSCLQRSRLPARRTLGSYRRRGRRGSRQARRNSRGRWFRKTGVHEAFATTRGRRPEDRDVKLGHQDGLAGHRSSEDVSEEGQDHPCRH